MGGLKQTNFKQKGFFNLNYSTIPFEFELAEEGFIFDLSELLNLFALLPDKRGRKGRQYGLAVLLTVAVLAKLAGQNQIRAVAHWAKLRAKELAHLFSLQRVQMPHHITWAGC